MKSIKPLCKLSLDVINPEFDNAATQVFTPPDYVWSGGGTYESGNVFAIGKVLPVDSGAAAAANVQGPGLSSRIPASSAETPVLQIEAADGTDQDETLDAITVRFVDCSYGQFDPKVDLLPLADDNTSGVLLYRTRDVEGQSQGYVQLSTTGLEWSEWAINAEGHAYRAVTLKSLESLKLPPDDLSSNVEAEFEIRLQFSNKFNLMDSFYVEIPDDGFKFAGGTSADDVAGGWTTGDGAAGVLFGGHVFDDGSNEDRRWNMTEPIGLDNAEDPVTPWYDGGLSFAAFTARDGDGVLLTNIFDTDETLAVTTDMNRAIYFNGTDYWYDYGGTLGVYDAGVDLPLFANAASFYRAYVPTEEGARSYHMRGAVPGNVENLVANGQTIAAESAGVAIAGINYHDSGRSWSPMQPVDLDADGGTDALFAVTVEAVSKNMAGGSYVLEYQTTAGGQLRWNSSAGGDWVDVAVDGRHVIDNSSGEFVVVTVAASEFPANAADATITISNDVDRDIEQPETVFGVRIHAVGAGNTVGAAATLSVDSANQLSWAGGTAVNVLGSAQTVDSTATAAVTTLFTTVGVHGLAVGDVVTIAGTINYNGDHVVLTVPSPTTFTLAIAWGGVAEGGTADSVGCTQGDGGDIMLFTTVADHGLAAGDSVTIADTTNYDGNHTVLSVPTTTTFTLGVAWVSDQSGTADGIGCSQSQVTNVTTFTTAAAHGLIAGDFVTVAGTTDYNGDHRVLHVPTPTTFTCAVSFVTDQSGTVQAARDGLYVLNADDTNYLVVQVDGARFGTNMPGTTDSLSVYSSDGRDITPFGQNITGLEVMAVSQATVIDDPEVGTHQFDYISASTTLAWTAGGVAIDVTADTFSLIENGDDFIVVRRTAENLPSADASEYVFINQAYLRMVQAIFENVDGFAATTHLEALTNSAGSGVALYRDTNGNGVFDDEDVEQLVPLLWAPTWNPDGMGAGDYLVRFRPDTAEPASALPGSQSSPTDGHDYFLVVKTTANISYGDQFRLYRADPGVGFSTFELTEPGPVMTMSYAAFRTGETLTCDTVTNTVYDDLTTSAQTIDAGSTTPVGLFAIDHWIRNSDDIYLQSITFTFDDVSGFDPEVDLATVSGTSASSGILLYTDNLTNPLNGDGDLDSTVDTRQNFTYVKNGSTYTLYPSTPIAVPKNDASPGQNDIFVAFLPSEDMAFGDAFSVTILKADGLEYSTGYGSPNSDLTTNTISATVPTIYDDLTTHIGTAAIPGLVVNEIVNATPGSYTLALDYSSANNGWYLTWNSGTPVAVDMNTTDTYALTSGSESIEVSFNPAAFLCEDTLIDGDGTVGEGGTTGSGYPSIALNTLLVDAATVSVAAAGTDPGGDGGLYYYDADGSGTFTAGDDVILKPNVDLPGSTLAYDGPTDVAQGNGNVVDDDSDGVDTDEDWVIYDGGDGINVDEGDMLSRFAASDHVAFQSAGVAAAYECGEDIVFDTDGIYTLPWLDMVLDTDGSATTGSGGATVAAADDLLVGAYTVSVPAGTDPGGAGC